jgi:prephenate dehydratase
MMKIAVLGPKGTFSELAFEKYFVNQICEPLFYSSIIQTVNALEIAKYAIVPVENTLDGYVQQVLDLLFEKNIFIVDEIYVPVQFSLIGNINHLSDIKRLYVQFVAKGQCQKFISSIQVDVNIITTESNTESYHLIQSRIFGDAAIVPHHLEKFHEGFHIHQVTDAIHNHTRFFVISKSEEKISSSTVKVSIVVVPITDRPGLLFDILGIFKTYDINLTSIMSRPTKTELGKYNFYIEMKTETAHDNKINQALNDIRKEFFIKILGIYPSRSI